MLTYSRPPYRRGVDPSCYAILWWWWCMRSWTQLLYIVLAGLGVSTLVRHGSSHVRGGWSADFHRLILPWEGTFLLEGRVTRAALLHGSADFRFLEGRRDGISRLPHCAEPYSRPSWGIKLEKGGFDGCLFPITFPVTVGLGGSMVDTLNALASVPTSGGGRRFCAQGPPIRSIHSRTRRSQPIEPLPTRRTLFPCTRPRSTSSPADHVSMSERRVGALIYLWTLLLWA